MKKDASDAIEDLGRLYTNSGLHGAITYLLDKLSGQYVSRINCTLYFRSKPGFYLFDGAWKHEMMRRPIEMAAGAVATASLLSEWDGERRRYLPSLQYFFRELLADEKRFERICGFFSDLFPSTKLTAEINAVISEGPGELQRVRIQDKAVLMCCTDGDPLFGMMFWFSREYPLQEEDIAFCEEATRMLGEYVSPETDEMQPLGYADGDPDRLLSLCSDLEPVLAKLSPFLGTDTTILLEGETGVGKEVVSDWIHGNSTRSKHPFVKVNCAALPESLLDSLFFGYERGAFTGASNRSSGYFEQAQHGTILLDEIGDLSQQAQAHLLRVLDSKEIQRLGGARRIPVDVRIIAATNRDLKNMVQKGTFRQDLWYRLNVCAVRIPPLRERINDLEKLIQYFIEIYVAKRNKENGGIMPLPIVTGSQMAALLRYSWPGNVRELRFATERAVYMLPISDRYNQKLIFELPEDGAASLAPIKRSEHGQTDYSRYNAERDKIAELLAGFAGVSGRLPTLDEVSRAYAEFVFEGCGKVRGRGGMAEILGCHPLTADKYLKSKMVGVS
ncbi:MAG: sigma 54-interacting transcriptional regulator [Mailhella sp.]|nr:sigma 54-interacting transcriptional regulator [Mailhella sp.]